MTHAIVEYHLRRERAERLASEAATSRFAADCHVQLADLHAARAADVLASAAANDSVAEGALA